MEEVQGWPELDALKIGTKSLSLRKPAAPRLRLDPRLLDHAATLTLLDISSLGIIEVYTCIRVYVYTCIPVFVYMCIRVCVYTCIRVYVYSYVYVCIYVCIRSGAAGRCFGS